MKNDWNAQKELDLFEKTIFFLKKKLLFFKLAWIEATEWNVYSSSCSDKAW